MISVKNLKAKLIKGINNGKLNKNKKFEDNMAVYVEHLKNIQLLE